MPFPDSLTDGLYALIETSRGEITVQLAFDKAPKTVANFVGLAEGTIPYSTDEGRPKPQDGRPFYDGIVFHRVIRDFMVQTGDPTGTGRGGPGYRFPDEIHPDLRHDRPGVLSMANAGPNTNGSQFFITHVPTPWLDGKHAVFGHVVTGQEIVDAIQQGDTIRRVSIKRVGSQAQGFQK